MTVFRATSRLGGLVPSPLRRQDPMVDVLDEARPLSSSECESSFMDVNAKDPVSMLALGTRIRGLRQRLNRTLSSTALAADISKPFLSQIERGRAMPSVKSLMSIARALGVTVQYFLDVSGESCLISHAEQLKYFTFAGSTNLCARLTGASIGRQLQAMLIRVPPGGESGEEMQPLVGELFAQVLSGEILLTVAGTTSALSVGDSAHCEWESSHRWANISKTEARVLCICTSKAV
jgi:transcriptional regulator with XRE-family HTH domain